MSPARRLLFAVALVGCTAAPSDDKDDTDTDADTGDTEVTVYYTSAGPLTADPSPVSVIALPGTFVDETGTLSLEVVGTGRPGIDLSVVEGGFVQSAQAALGDLLRIVDETGTRVELTLDDDPAEVAAPSGDADDGSGMPPEGPDDSGGDFAEDAPSVQGGQIDVGDGALPGFVAPYLAYVPEQGASAAVAAGQAPVLLTAEDGDTLCVAPLNRGQAGLSVCWTVE